MSPNIWGPPTWCFFHTLAEKINPDMFNQLFPQIFNYIIRICRVLPCPDCSLHASQFLSKVNLSGIKNKEDFKNLMCIFHNMVNHKKNKRQFYFENLPAIYDNKNIINVYNNFLKIFHTKGNMKFLAETFQRKLILSDLRKWIMLNAKSFFTPVTQLIELPIIEQEQQLQEQQLQEQQLQEQQLQ